MKDEFDELEKRFKVILGLIGLLLILVAIAFYLSLQ
jgi:hypothetical protein